MNQLFSLFPPDGVKIALVFLLSFLIGLEREEHKRDSQGVFIFGGVRAFPLIGLLGYALANFSGDHTEMLGVGFAILGLFLAISYFKKLQSAGAGVASVGMTSEISALFTFTIGALVFREDYWIATTLVVFDVFILELKRGLEGLTTKIPSEEIYTFAKFLFLSAVILPVIPNQEYTFFQLNPFKTWLVVVVISGISYAAYVLDKVLGSSGGVLISSFLGGAYSSTITTLVLARRTQREELPRLFSGAILIASGMMYLRLIALLALLSSAVAARLAPVFLPLGFLAIGFGYFWSKTQVGKTAAEIESPTRNPLEIRSACIFACLFVAMAVATHWTQQTLGSTGVYGLSFLSGLSDVDPFIMSISQSGASTPLDTMVNAIAIATVSNNLLKSIYVYSIAKGAARRQAAGFLIVLVVLGVLGLFMVGNW